MFYPKFIMILLVLGYNASIPTYDIELKDLLKMQKGLGWPSVLQVAKGQEALMKLTATLANQHSCQVTTPSGEVFDVTSPPRNRYERWGDGCGLRVRNVEKADQGRWRLTAVRGTDSVTGWIEVTVEEDTPSYTAPPISLQDGETHADIELTSLANSYCLVAQPFSESSLISGHCRVTLDKATRAVQGDWDVLIGLPGRIAELHVERRVAVETERLNVGFTHDSNSNKIHLFCNILHTTKNVTFCRFQQTSKSMGYNVMEGLSDGVHSYYGNGFVAKQCGMTIENPTSEDYGTWRCSVGSQQWVGNALVPQTPMQALINVIHDHRSGREVREAKMEEDVETVFVQEDRSFTVRCHAKVSLSYCWFLHPNGSQFSPVPLVNEDQLFWYAGQSLQTGDCGITFSHANISDAGTWVCHMGANDQPGIELTDRVQVRVTGPLAANKKEIGVGVGQNVTLYCHTSNGNRPLDYCRFLSPNFLGINLDSSVTRERAILDRFYFTPGRSLDYGDCSLTIIAVQPEDIGTWTCAAMINTDALESKDTMELFIYKKIRPPRVFSEAGIAGMVIGITALVILLAGLVWYKKGKPVPWKRTQSSQATVGELPFDLMSVPRGSNSSTSSNENSSGEDSSGNAGASSNPVNQGGVARDVMVTGTS
ncbi:hypothetical protein ABMA28_016329 [Loxostege sticticalis]|uniref:Ig-like domain-containing protein n=1 Tax=Loxostege sticticalis TaxID=481309 RepID=A0ABD0TBG6_LOXSC